MCLSQSLDRAKAVLEPDRKALRFGELGTATPMTLEENSPTWRHHDSRLATGLLPLPLRLSGWCFTDNDEKMTGDI